MRATLLTIAFLSMIPSSVTAEGLILSVPEDGAWAEFNITGTAIDSQGKVQITIHGSQKVRSVGKSVVEKKDCRWIELETQLTFRRDGGNAKNYSETLKLLIPEKYLRKGKNPREHVLKAYRLAGDGTVRKLDITGDDQRQIEGIEEVFHAPLKTTTELPKKTIKTKTKTWVCAGFHASSQSGSVTFNTETRTHQQAPFGVVSYRYEKVRTRNGNPAGTRSMKWLLVESGTDAKSSAPDAQ